MCCVTAGAANGPQLTDRCSVPKPDVHVVFTAGRFKYFVPVCGHTRTDGSVEEAVDDSASHTHTSVIICLHSGKLLTWELPALVELLLHVEYTHTHLSGLN